MKTWYQYRTVWSRNPLILAYAVVVAAVFLLAIVGMAVGGPLTVLFIPSLAGAYAHHLLVMRRVER